jgi:hypothetical protein
VASIGTRSVLYWAASDLQNPQIELNCAFTIVVAQGASTTVVKPGHTRGSNTTVLDYLVDDAGGSGAKSQTEPCLLSLDQGFQFRAQPPQNELFSVFVPANASVQVYFSLSWCRSGTVASRQDLLPYNFTLSLDDLSPEREGQEPVVLTMRNMSAGVSADYTCLTMSGLTAPIEASFRFFAFRAVLGQRLAGSPSVPGPAPTFL